MTGDGSVIAGPPEAPTGPSVQTTFSLVARDLFEPGAAGSRNSRVSALFGIVMVPGSVFGLLMGDLSTVPLVLVGIGLLTGVIPAAVMVFMASRRPDILALEQHVTIDAQGVRMRSERATSSTTWPMFKRVRETGSAFLLDLGMGAANFVPKRELDAGEVAAIQAIATAQGKLDRRSSWHWSAVGIGLGAAVTVVILALTL